jgi:ElaB/YqjD/DUF883 family membrane-anchored ribosome-binding protein
VRAHWGIENRLHWVLDVVFPDDLASLRTGYRSENMALASHMATNLPHSANPSPASETAASSPAGTSRTATPSSEVPREAIHPIDLDRARSDFARPALTRHETKRGKMTDMQGNGGDGSLTGGAQAQIDKVRENVQGLMNSPRAGEALDRLRAVRDQASQKLRDIGQQSGQWTQAAQNRAGAMARRLREQSGVAVDSVSRQVEQNPLTSIGIAFAVGFACAALIRR